MLYFFIFEHWVHFLSFGDTRSPGMFGPTDFKNSCIVACVYIDTFVRVAAQVVYILETKKDA